MFPLCHKTQPVAPLPRNDTKMQVCANGGVDNLTLSTTNQPEATFYPNLLEGDLLLSLAPYASDTKSTEEGESTADSSRSCSGTGGRVAWSVLGQWSSPGTLSTQEQDQGNWTVFPSTGLLLPGER